MFAPEPKKTLYAYLMDKGLWKLRNHCIHHRNWLKCDACQEDMKATDSYREALRKERGPFARVDVWYRPKLAWYARLLNSIRPAWRKLLVFLRIKHDYEIPFFTISSEAFEKSEEELLGYEVPVSRIIEENSMKDLYAVEDRVFTPKYEYTNAVPSFEQPKEFEAFEKLHLTRKDANGDPPETEEA